MTYKETTNWMFNQLPMFQTQGASAYKKDLTNSLLLSNHLNFPESKFKSIHVGGTNGKGSTSSMIASILQEAGYKVGLYTSPHLKDFRERIRINGEMISENFVVDFIADNKPFFEVNQLSFFEMTVGLAFDYFAKSKVDIAVIEVGMGGRLDSTNIITPLVSVITNIGFDHTQFLGDTLTKISYEKAGIIKSKIPVVIGEYCEETKQVFIDKAIQENAAIYFAQDTPEVDLECGLKGNYQAKNKKTVLQTIRLLKPFFNIEKRHVVAGFKNVIQNTGLLGRWQILSDNPQVVCDTAHNSHGLCMVLDQIKATSFKNLYIVLGVVNDKDLTKILPLFPSKAVYFFCRPNIPRGLNAEILQQQARPFNLIGEAYDSVSSAYKKALELADENDFIFIGGSTFVVAEII